MNPIYITLAMVQADPALMTLLGRMQWTDAQLTACIVEAESYIEGCIMRLGYLRNQLTLAPEIPAQLMITLVTNWVRYTITRDAYADSAPQQGTGERYEKWKKLVEDTIAKLEPDKNGNILLQLIDNAGNVISPASIDQRFKVESNTLHVSQAITMDSSDHWRIDQSQSSREAIGKKPGEHVGGR